jgi:hypothetical protein
MKVSMIPVRDLFESHLTVTDLQRSMSFFGQTLGLELAEVFWERLPSTGLVGEATRCSVCGRSGRAPRG